MTEVLNRETGELTEVDEEALAAEMSPDDEPGEPEPETDEPETERRAPSGASPDEIDKAFKAVERSFTNYIGKIDALTETGAVALHICPLCPSQHKGFVDLNRAGAVPDDVKQETMYFLGFAREQEYEADPSTEECRVCKGKGATATGSKVANNGTRTCSNCRGFGYYPPPGGPVNTDAPVDVMHAPVGQTLTPLDNDDVDLSGEPRVLPDGRPNPNFQKWPQYKVQVAPWGTTLGLTAQDVTP